MATPSQRLFSSSSQKKTPLSKSNTLSQQNSPVALDNLLCMPLAKYSYGTTFGLQSKPTWTHLPDRDNMFAVFDLISSKGFDHGVNQKYVLKVVRGSNLIEIIDLDALRQQALRDEERAGLMNFQDADRLVIVIVKTPLVAIRYPLPNGQVRRLQMRFVHGSDYSMTVGLLQRLELPIRDPNPTSRPQTGISNSSSTAQLRPADAPAQPHDEHPSAQRASVPGPSKHDSAARSSSVTLESSPCLGSSHISGLAPHSTALQGSTSIFHQGPRDELPSPARPSSSSIVLDAGPNRQRFPSAQACLFPGTYFNPSRTIPESPFRPSSIATSSPVAGGIFGSSTAQINLTPTMPRGALFEEKLSGMEPVLHAGVDDDANLDQLLPPKRELPFAKPMSKPPSRDAVPILHSTSSLDPLPIPGAVSIKRPAKTQSSTLKTKPKQPTTPAGEPSLLSTDLSAVESSENIPSSSYRPSTTSISTTFSSADIPPSSPPAAYAAKNRALTSLVSAGGNQSDPGRPKNPTEQITNPKDNEVSDEYFARIDAFVQKHHSRSLADAYFGSAAADRAAFAALPEAERLAAIDAEIMECIMDDNFVQLCEDVEKSWKRIALGF